jgi:antitoxin (DNA-binding transcriptional repressor) of toxin-antitoxin stability system
MSTAPVIPLRTFRKNLPGYIRSAKAGHDVLIGASAPEVRLVRVSAETMPSNGEIHVAPDLFADLIISGAEAAASNVAQAQCAEGDIDRSLKRGLGDTMVKLLNTDDGSVWAGLYFRAFMAALHRFEHATALPLISLSALLTHLSLSLKTENTSPDRWGQLQDNIFGRKSPSASDDEQVASEINELKA